MTQSSLELLTETFVMTGMEPGHAHEKAREILLAAAQTGYRTAMAELGQSGPQTGAVRLPPNGYYVIRYLESGIPDDVFSGEGALEIAMSRFLSVSSGYHCRLLAPVRSSIHSDLTGDILVCQPEDEVNTS